MVTQHKIFKNGKASSFYRHSGSQATNLALSFRAFDCSRYACARLWLASSATLSQSPPSYNIPPLFLSCSRSYRKYNVGEHDVERTSVFLSLRHFFFIII